jgi:hypothetical protein
MAKMMISTMIIFASSMCLGFATQAETEIPEKSSSIIEQGDPTDDDASSVPPVLEKCKKKKK